VRTPFYYLHVKYGARIVDFQGWEMPLQYSGIIEEHVNTRNNVSLFDVSHMGRFEANGREAFELLQILATNDLSKLHDGQALYTPICCENGGILDDLIIYRINSTRFLVVVNASNRVKDFEWITSHSKKPGVVKDISNSTALLAVQGPLSAEVLKLAFPSLNLESLKPFDFISTNILSLQNEEVDKDTRKEDLTAATDPISAIEGDKENKEKNLRQNVKNELLISRTGYTGEDGFELLFDSSRIDVWDKLLQIGLPYNIKPAGLGARDTLRLEAGLLLYGSDMDETTTPFEVPLKWTVKLQKTDFVGKQSLITKPVSKKLVGFEVLEKRISRHGNRVLIDGKTAGYVTSGGYSPTLRKSIGLCFVPPDTPLAQGIEIEISGKKYKSKVTSSTRFYKRK
jgi:aminomethyltransferase